MMKKSCSLLALFVFVCLSLFSQTDTQTNVFVEYKLLKPTISNIENTADIKDRRIYYYVPNSRTIQKDSLLRYDPANNEEWRLPLSLIELLYPVGISGGFWDFHKRFNYVYLYKQEYGANIDLKAGWNKVDILEDNSIYLEPVDDYAPSLRNTPSSVIMNSGHILYSKTTLSGILKKKDEEFKVVDSNTGETIWTYTGKGIPFDTNVYWIGGNWLFKENSAFSGGGVYDVNHIIFNYLTGEERSFAPGIIIGFGEGYIMTTTKELVGITIRDMENHIIFQDTTFELTGMLNIRYAKMIDFGYIDLPYVYYTVYSMSGPNRSECSVVLNLRTKKTYMTRTAWNLLGVF
jgi:hypothetical protein